MVRIFSCFFPIFRIARFLNCDSSDGCDGYDAAASVRRNGSIHIFQHHPRPLCILRWKDIHALLVFNFFENGISQAPGLRLAGVAEPGVELALELVRRQLAAMVLDHPALEAEVEAAHVFALQLAVAVEYALPQKRNAAGDSVPAASPERDAAVA